MTYDGKRRAAERSFIEQQRIFSCKKAFFWFLKRLILFAVLIGYTVIGAYIFQVSHLHPTLRLSLLQRRGV